MAFIADDSLFFLFEMGMVYGRAIDDNQHASEVMKYATNAKDEEIQLSERDQKVSTE